MTDDDGRGGHQAVARPPGKAPRTIASQDLFSGERLVIIRHEHDDYRLQMTAAGKLLLTK